MFIKGVVYSKYGHCYPKISTKNMKFINQILNRDMSVDKYGTEDDRPITKILSPIVKKLTSDVYINHTTSWRKVKIRKRKRVGKQKHRNLKK